MITLPTEPLGLLALAAILVPLGGAAAIAASERASAKWLCQGFAAATVAVIAILAMSLLGDGKVGGTYELISFGSVSILGLVVDSVSVLIALAVIASVCWWRSIPPPT